MPDRVKPERSPASGTTIAAVLATAAVLWGLTLLLVPPYGDFPLNDDWIYARAVQGWMDTGHYTGHPFATANLIGQAWWGKLFCSIFGFSFTALRWSTLVLWLLASWAVGLAALGLRARPLAAALAACLVIANPLAMNLGYTFMTDVPFMAALALAGFCYLRALADPRWQWVLAGSLFGAWGLLIRQFAVLLPLAFVLAAATLIVHLGFRRLLPLAIALALPWLAAMGLLLCLPSYAEALGHTWNADVLGKTWAVRVFGGFKFYAVAMNYLALFAAPLALPAACYWWRHKEGCWKRRSIGMGLIFVVIVLLVCWGEPHRIPFLGNLLYDTGVGPMTLKGIFTGSFDWRPVAIGRWWWLPTLLGLAGVAWMVAGVIRWFVLIPGDGRRPLGDPRRRQQCFLLFWAIFMIAALYHPWLPVRFDRYFLGALAPVLLILAAASWGRGKAYPAVAILGLAALYAFSIVSLQDYMAWNTARWEIANRLMEKDGIPPTEIDAGYEFNGWYTSPLFIESEGARAFLHSGRLGWWAVNDTWAVSWLPRPGFKKVEEIPYNSWLAREKGKLLLLKRKAK